VLEQAAMLSDDLRLGAAAFAPILPLAGAEASGARGTAPEPLPRAIAELERRSIESALEATKGNKVSAARLLGISRATLYEKLAAIKSMSA
jgi:DNA-binding NtrC family response regulator